MDPETESRVASFVEPGERLLWSGRPGRGIRVRSGDRFAIPFSLLWAGTCIYIEVGAVRRGAPLFNQLWGIAFVVMGVHFVLGRFIFDAWRRARTVYGVTDRRVLIIGKSNSVTSLDLRNLPGLTLAERSDGSGDIVFGTTSGAYVGAGGMVPRGMVVPEMLEFLPKVRDVYDIVCQAQRANA